MTLRCLKSDKVVCGMNYIMSNFWVVKLIFLIECYKPKLKWTTDSVTLQIMYYPHNAIFRGKKFTRKILSAMNNIFSLMCNLTNSVNSSLIWAGQLD